LALLTVTITLHSLETAAEASPAISKSFPISINCSLTGSIIFIRVVKSSEENTSFMDWLKTAWLIED